MTIKRGAWMVGHNRAGYLPDNPPAAYPTFQAAREALKDEMLEVALSFDQFSQDLQQRFNDVGKSLDSAPEADYEVTHLDRVWFITYDPEVDVEI
jgi:hypothetical protein